MGLLSGMMGGAAAGGGAAGPVDWATDGTFLGRWERNEDTPLVVGSNLSDSPSGDGTVTTPNGTAANVYDATGAANLLTFNLAGSVAGNSKYTVAAFVKPNAWGNGIHMFYAGASTSSNVGELSTIGGNIVAARITSNGSTGVTGASLVGAWMSLVCVFDGASSAVYIDGVQQGGTLNLGSVATTSSLFRFGQSLASNFSLAAIGIYTGDANTDAYFASKYGS